jgi:hypothetical protein
MAGLGTGTNNVTIHIPVLPAEVIEGMQPKPGQTVVDGTLGGGGHSRMLLELIVIRWPSKIRKHESKTKTQR